jgi:tetratricopeptide (TPR) repeat protein
MDAKSDAINTPGKDAREIISHLNMERQVRTVLDNFGLIVVGYAGGDKTIMQMLEQVSEHNGLYWCYIKDYPPDVDVLKLVKSKNGKLVKIAGFDDMMKEIADVTNFSIDDLLTSFEKRKETLVERITKFNEDYTKKSLGEYAEELTEKQKDKPSENLSAVDYFVLGDRAYKDGNYVLAEENYRKAIELNSTHSGVYVNLGNILAGDKKFRKEAEETYLRAIELDPLNDVAYNNLGVFYMYELKRLEAAEENFREAIELAPTKSMYHLNLGALLYAQKQINEAIDSIKKSIELDERNSSALITLAAINKKLGNTNELKKYIEKIRLIIENDDYYSLARLNSILNDKETALKNLKQAVDKNSLLRVSARESYALEWIRDDERFWEIVGRDE